MHSGFEGGRVQLMDVAGSPGPEDSLGLCDALVQAQPQCPGLAGSGQAAETLHVQGGNPVKL